MGNSAEYIRVMRFPKYLCHLHLYIDILYTELKLNVPAIRWYQLSKGLITLCVGDAFW